MKRRPTPTAGTQTKERQNKMNIASTTLLDVTALSQLDAFTLNEKRATVEPVTVKTRAGYERPYFKVRAMDGSNSMLVTPRDYLRVLRKFRGNFCTVDFLRPNLASALRS